MKQLCVRRFAQRHPLFRESVSSAITDGLNATHLVVEGRKWSAVKCLPWRGGIDGGKKDLRMNERRGIIGGACFQTLPSLDTEEVPCRNRVVIS